MNSKSVNNNIKAICNWLLQEENHLESRLGACLRHALLLPLELAVKVSSWLSDHGQMGLGWLAIVLIIGGSGFGAVAGPLALLGHLAAINTHWIIFGMVGGCALDVFIIRLDLEIAAH